MSLDECGSWETAATHGSGFEEACYFIAKFFSHFTDSVTMFVSAVYYSEKKSAILTLVFQHVSKLAYFLKKFFVRNLLTISRKISFPTFEQGQIKKL